MDYLFGAVVLLTFITLIWCIVLSIQLNNRTNTLKKHDKCARRFASKISAIRKEKGDDTLDSISSDVEDILLETHGISSFLKTLCWVLIPFCVVISSLYLVTHFPRLINQVQCDAGQSSYAHLGVDYLGIIVGFLTLLVTLLVAWNIYSTIKAKDELKDAKGEIINLKNKSQDEIKRVSDEMRKLPQEKFDKIEQHLNLLETQLNDMEDCCSSGKKEIGRLDKKIDLVNNASMLFVSSQSLIRASRFEDKDKKTDAYMVSMAYSTLWQAIYQYLVSKTEKRNVLGCISQLKTCLMILSIDNLQFIKEQFDSANEWYEKIKKIDIEESQDVEIMTALNEISSLQEQIGWDEEWEKRREAFKEFDKERDRLKAEEETRKAQEAENKGDAPH